jgi:hypothetical protein
VFYLVRRDTPQRDKICRQSEKAQIAWHYTITVQEELLPSVAHAVRINPGAAFVPFVHYARLYTGMRRVV